jgi:protein TonB
VDKIRNFRGSLELLIDERGKVLTVVVAQSVHPDYDAALARAARDWTFQPAKKDGAAVRYRLTMEITLAATNR